MYNVWDVMEIAANVFNTRQKRHLLGGALISISLLFGGLAVTIITAKDN